LGWSSGCGATLFRLDKERDKLSRLQASWEKAIVRSHFCTEDSAVCAEHCIEHEELTYIPILHPNMQSGFVGQQAPHDLKHRIVTITNFGGLVPPPPPPPTTTTWVWL